MAEDSSWLDALPFVDEGECPANLFWDEKCAGSFESLVAGVPEPCAPLPCFSGKGGLSGTATPQRQVSSERDNNSSGESETTSLRVKRKRSSDSDEERKEKNRKSAAASRLRKKQAMAGLLEQVRRLEQEKAVLLAEVTFLRRERHNNRAYNTLSPCDTCSLGHVTPQKIPLPPIQPKYINNN